LFWLGVAGVVIMGLMALINGQAIPGLVMIILGPIFVRLYCEVLIVLFRIEENTRK